MFGATLVALVGGLAAVPAARAGAASSRITPVSKASTSSRGVTAHSINVEFPVANLQSLSSQFGFAGDVEYTEQVKAIDLFVHHVNADGRHQRPDDQPDDHDLRSDQRCRVARRCARTGPRGARPSSPCSTASGRCTGDSQLCITQQGHTPFLGQWTTVSNWTTAGLALPVVDGARRRRHLAGDRELGAQLAASLGRSRKVGVLAGDRASDQLALKKYLLPDLKKIGVHPVVVTIPAQPSETAATNSAAQLAVERFKGAGVNSLIPLIPFNAFFPVLADETSQNYFPRLLLSDYENSIESALGLIPDPVREGTGRPGGRDDRDAGRRRRLPAAVPGRLRPGRPAVLGHLAQGVPADPQGQHERLHRGAGSRPGLVPGDPALRRGRHHGRKGSQHGGPSSRPCRGSPTSPADTRPCSATGRTSSSVRPSTKWSACTQPPAQQPCAGCPSGTLPPQVVCWHVVQTWKPLPATRLMDRDRRRGARAVGAGGLVPGGGAPARRDRRGRAAPRCRPCSPRQRSSRPMRIRCATSRSGMIRIG